MAETQAPSQDQDGDGSQNGPSPLAVGIVGLGAIGGDLALRLSGDRTLGAELVGVAARDKGKARARLQDAVINVPVLDVAALAAAADLVVECAPAAAFAGIARPVLAAGKRLMVLSCGALLDNPELVDLARETGGRIIVPSGAILGLDAVSAAAEGEIASVRMITRKPVEGLIGAPYLTEHGIDISGIGEPMRLFEGTAREAAKGFPANLNVAVALSLAGIGPDRTILEIWADPALTRNTHRIVVESDSARLEMTIENIPSENPRTGRITALSVIAAIRKLTAPLSIGT
ncbi:MAG: aspartate dehydrogenase [Alphaproteobacteria bacterium]|nr:aspartate dehydrogenase [Alphaproteobacteria bacterium]